MRCNATFMQVTHSTYMPPPEQHPGIDQTRTDRCRQVNIVPCTLLSCGALWTDYVPMHGNLGCLHFRQCILPAAFLSVPCHRLEPVGKRIMAHCKASVAAPSASHAAFSTSTGAATWFALAPLVALAQLWGVVLLQFTLPETRLRQWDRDNGSAAATSGNSFYYLFAASASRDYPTTYECVRSCCTFVLPQ